MNAPDLSQAVWRKSTRSTSEGNCVEVARLPVPTVAVRDSKNPGPALTLPTSAWSRFLYAAR